ncbi:hypothetical protein JCM10213_002932 [Rhodosporidiobolus nylandii]
MLSRPHTPTPRVHATSIVRLLEWGLLANVLLPHAGYAIQAVNAAEDGPPVWPAWLEPWYTVICPRAWELLQPDDELDEAVVHALVAYKEARKRAGAEQDELDDIARQARELRTRRLVRWCNIYALHGVRQRFLKFYSAREPGSSADEIVRLHAAQVENAPPPPSAAPHSVWPFDISHPRSRSSSAQSSAGCACKHRVMTFADVISLFCAVDCSPYMFPDVPSPESDQYIYDRLGRRRGGPVVCHVGAEKTE